MLKLEGDMAGGRGLPAADSRENCEPVAGLT